MQYSETVVLSAIDCCKLYEGTHIVAHTVAHLRTLCASVATITAAVTVNAVLPGPTWTERVAEFIKGIAAKDSVSVEQATADYFTKQEPTSLLGRFLKPEEVANAILYISSQVHGLVHMNCYAFLQLSYT
jgi:NAD(P)-dependent dehydrogenase (short-subunit alcohol dehydrogenase family)